MIFPFPALFARRREIYMYRKVLVELIVYAVVFIIVILLCTLPNIIGEYQYAKFHLNGLFHDTKL